MPLLKPPKCSDGEEVVSNTPGPCTYRPINSEMKIGIWPPWECFNGNLELLARLKTQFGLSRIIAYPDQLDMLSRTGVWNNADIMVSLNDTIPNQSDLSDDQLYAEFLRQISIIQARVDSGGMYYGVSFDEIFREDRARLFKSPYSADVYRAIKMVRNSEHPEQELRIFFGAYYINDASTTDVGYFRQVEHWADGLLYTRYVRSFMDSDQTGDWERLRNEYRDKITSGYIALPCSFDERGRSMMIKDCDKDSLDYYLRRAKEFFQNTIWVYAERSGFCSELWEQLMEVNRRIYHTFPRPSLSKALEGMDPELAFLVRKHGAELYLGDCTTGDAKDAMCHMFCRRLQMLVEAAARQGWMKRECCQWRTVSRTNYTCILDNCEECWNEYNQPVGPWRVKREIPQTSLVCEDKEMYDRKNWFAGCDKMFTPSPAGGEMDYRETIQGEAVLTNQPAKEISGINNNVAIAKPVPIESPGMEVFERRTSIFAQIRKNILPVLLLSLVGFACDMPERHFPVRTYTVVIDVVDSFTKIPLSNVLIVERAENIPDSYFYQGDSIRMDYGNFILWHIASNGFTQMGYYDSDITKTSYPVYRNYYAYLNGYALWHYDSTRNKPIRLWSQTDSLRIELVRR